jgi:hypothetical protein
MRTEPVEIYSDATNAAIMRHPGRKYPGVLVQGDTLNSLYVLADAVCRRASHVDPDMRDELEDLRQRLGHLLAHYKATLTAHGIPLPFNAQADK